jgi:pyruvate/2-oxoacid:ferredoxin oxidoreductase beta subunit
MSARTPDLTPPVDPAGRPGAGPARTHRPEAYPGPPLILAYSHGIAHGFDLRFRMRQQSLAAASGYWPLFRYNPAMRAAGAHPWQRTTLERYRTYEGLAALEGSDLPTPAARTQEPAP